MRNILSTVALLLCVTYGVAAQEHKFLEIMQRGLRSSSSSRSSSSGGSETCGVEFCEAPYHTDGWCKRDTEYLNMSNPTQRLECHCICETSCCGSGTEHPCYNDDLDSGECTVIYCDTDCDLVGLHFGIGFMFFLSMVMCTCICRAYQRAKQHQTGREVANRAAS